MSLWVMDRWNAEMHTGRLLAGHKDLSSERIGALGFAVGNEANQKREHASHCVDSGKRRGAGFNAAAMK